MRVWEGKFLINWKFTVWKGEKRKNKKKKTCQYYRGGEKEGRQT